MCPALAARRARPLALMKSADWVPKQSERAGFDAWFHWACPIPGLTGPSSQLITPQPIRPTHRCRGRTALHGRRHVGRITRKHCPGDARGLVGQRDRHETCRLTLQHSSYPKVARIFLPGVADDGGHAGHQQHRKYGLPCRLMRPSRSFPPLFLGCGVTHQSAIRATIACTSPCGPVS
jgi:hypothetical protein